jgi:probable rRNA maturation factor
MKHTAHVLAEPRYAAYRRGLGRSARAALTAARAPAAEVGLMLAGDALVRRLSRRFLGTERTTDVLAFPLAEKPRQGDARYLGDIVISVPQARRQASESGHGLRDELALLSVHGVLHLLGYDHKRAKERRRMAELQSRVVRRLGLRLAVDPWTR